MDEQKESEILLDEKGQLPEEEPKQETEPCVERPRSQRILAWVLFVIFIIGVIFWYYWIAKG